ncbi:MAG: 3-oxoacyl-[acyl-carrier-protein] reductase [Gemmatimonadota bacterium]|nr:3-oxoacyl-[acyl-carrier-protein] reductase [Gemmatimonadota bacterium]MDH5803627.1 3-oxoacyl-[acyl-carrier-protein] reductase [Gemmatimonadota bacterium]
MIDLSGKVAVVTGGSRGIGLACAERLVEVGAQVGLIARDKDRVEKAAKSLGIEAFGVAADVSDAEQAQNAISQIEEKLGPVDILVNNAGLTRDGLLVRMSEADWDDVLNVNLKGAFHLTKAIARGMMKRRFGRIINITSVVGLMGNAGQANYAASKAGLIGFTKATARELASRNVLVNAIAPGYIETDMTDALSEDVKTALMGQIPLGRLGQGSDIANSVVFLSSDLAGYITGQVMVVDGGMVM